MNIYQGSFHLDNCPIDGHLLLFYFWRECLGVQVQLQLALAEVCVGERRSKRDELGEGQGEEKS